MKLKLEPEEVPAIAKRIGTDEAELAGKLEEMAQKGLIYRVRWGTRTIPGLPVHRWGIRVPAEAPGQGVLRAFRAIPSLSRHEHGILADQPASCRAGGVRGREGGTVEPYNQIRDLVKEQKVISVQDCICRTEQDLLGNPCEKPKEICIGFGDMAQFTIDNNAGRQIDVEECFKTLDKAEEAGLVLQPSNTENLEWICCCCSCCCPGLKIAKSTPRPQDLVRTYYEAKIDADECTACGDCIERCPMDAIAEGDNVSEMVDGRCIGCGLCVSVCPVEAISLEPKPDMEAPPRTSRRC